MKLIMCPHCGDVIQLRMKERTCECGRVRGNYLEDGSHARVSKDAISIAIGNGSLRMAVHNAKALCRNTNNTANREDYITHGQIVYAWVRPNEGLGNPHTKVIEESKDSQGDSDE